MNSLKVEGNWNKTRVTPKECKGELYMERTAKAARQEGFHWEQATLSGAKCLWGVELAVNHFGKEFRVLLLGKQRRTEIDTQMQETEGGVISSQPGPWRIWRAPVRELLCLSKKNSQNIFKRGNLQSRG